MAEGVWNGSMCNSACPAVTEHQGGPQDIQQQHMAAPHPWRARQGAGAWLHMPALTAPQGKSQPTRASSRHFYSQIPLMETYCSLSLMNSTPFASSQQLLEGWKSNPGSVKYSDFKQCFFPKTFKISWIWFDGHPNTLCTAEQEAAFTDPSRFALDEEGGSLLHSACAGDAEPQLFLY